MSPTLHSNRAAQHLLGVPELVVNVHEQHQVYGRSGQAHILVRPLHELYVGYVLCRGPLFKALEHGRLKIIRIDHSSGTVVRTARALLLASSSLRSLPCRARATTSMTSCSQVAGLPE